MLEPFFQFWGQSHRCSYYHRDHCCSPDLLQFVFQPLVFLELLLLLFANFLSITISINTAFFWYLSTTTKSGWLPVSSFSARVWKSYRILAWSFSTSFGGVSNLDREASSPNVRTDVSVHYASHLVMVLHVRPACLHQPATTCCYVLDCLRGIFTHLLLVCHDLCLCAVFQSSFFQPLVGFLSGRWTWAATLHSLWGVSLSWYQWPLSPPSASVLFQRGIVGYGMGGLMSEGK